MRKTAAGEKEKCKSGFPLVIRKSLIFLIASNSTLTSMVPLLIISQLMLHQPRLLKLKLLDIPYIVEIENLNQHSLNTQPLLDAYHSYQEIIDLADSLATNFPGICKKFIFGYSIENRQLAALEN